jgi:hypothetical protein
MRRILIACLALACTLAPISAAARPNRGFNVGPYLDLIGGVSQATFDRDQTTGIAQGSDFQPTFGFLFGWNVVDSLAAELQGRYATDPNHGDREHIAYANVMAKWMPIFDALTDFPTLRILPFLKGGMGVTVAILPGAPGSDGSKLTTVGFGPTLGGGIAFICKKYVHFGIDLQEDLHFFQDKTQTVNGVPGTLVYKGGFHPLFSAMGFVGVHY